MKITDMLIEELNEVIPEEKKEAGEKWERLHSEQYQIVTTEKGVFHNPITDK